MGEKPDAQKRFKHVTLEDVILDPYLKEWFIDYFQFDRRRLNFNWVGQKGFVNCIKYLKKQKKNYPSNYLHHLLNNNYSKYYNNSIYFLDNKYYYN